MLAAHEVLTEDSGLVAGLHRARLAACFAAACDPISAVLPQTKLARLRAAFAAGNTIEALRIAARFPRLGEQGSAIQRAWAAYSNPSFYRQIGHDPDLLIAAGVDALRDKYRL